MNPTRQQLCCRFPSSDLNSSPSRAQFTGRGGRTLSEFYATRSTLALLLSNSSPPLSASRRVQARVLGKSITSNENKMSDGHRRKTIRRECVSAKTRVALGKPGLWMKSKRGRAWQRVERSSHVKTRSYTPARSQLQRLVRWLVGFTKRVGLVGLFRGQRSKLARRRKTSP